MEYRNSLVILDRDGVINRKSLVEGEYILEIADLFLNLDIILLIVELQIHGSNVAVATNQQCVGKGILSNNKLDEMHIKINELITSKGGKAITFYVCPHLVSVGCQCRKPKPGLLLEAMKDYSTTHVNTLFVGDSETDEQAAKSIQIPFIKHLGDTSKTRLAIKAELGTK